MIIFSYLIIFAYLCNVKKLSYETIDFIKCNFKYYVIRL